MDLQIELLFSLAVIAALYGSVGHGGASGYLAVLSLSIFASHGAIWLKPHALCLNIVVASMGLYYYGRQGFFSMKLILPFVLTSIPFAYFGAYLPIVDWLFDTALSLTLLWAAWRLVMAANVDSDIYDPPSPSVSLAIGAGLGLVSGLVGIGGGIFLSPLLILKRWASPKATAAVSAFFILVNSIAGLAGAFSSGQARLDSDLIIQFALAVLIGGFMGTRFGANHASDQMIRRLLAVVLVVAVVRRVLGLVGLWP
jgi:uncharacterized membrane protein YfcA